jgi:hypothetical protein
VDHERKRLLSLVEDVSFDLDQPVVHYWIGVLIWAESWIMPNWPAPEVLFAVDEESDFEASLIDSDFDVDPESLLAYKITFCYEGKSSLPFETWMSLIMERDSPWLLREKMSFPSFCLASRLSPFVFRRMLKRI